MSNARRDNGPLVVGGEPRIDFLPPETKKRKESRRQRRSLVALVIVIAIICGLGYYGSTYLAGTSQAALELEQAKTQDLLEQQREYADAKAVATELQTVKDARIVGSANEVMWSDYFDKIRALNLDIGQPLGAAAITDYVVDSPSSTDPLPIPNIPLQKPRLATIFLTVATPLLATADRLLARLPELPGFADAVVTTIDLDTTTGLYSVSYVLNVNADVLERRFFETEATPATEDEDEG